VALNSRQRVTLVVTAVAVGCALVFGPCIKTSEYDPRFRMEREDDPFNELLVALGLAIIGGGLALALGGKKSESSVAAAAQDTTPQTDAPATGRDKSLAWLSYVGILWLAPMLAAKDSPFCRFHVKQGITLTIFWFAVGILGVIPFVGWFIIWPAGILFGLAMAIMGIINAAGGKRWKMPLLGGIAARWFK